MPAGATLGRAAGGPEDPGLYRTSLLVDKRLSRTHLRWEGPGRITWLRPDVRGAQGEAVVHAGEGLQPSAGTHLRGRA